jgi:hypothetical protein
MQALINEAFAHVKHLDQQVQSGVYDLVGPDGDVILPQVWETVVEPDWSVTMIMWPIPDKPPRPGYRGPRTAINNNAPTQ